MKTIFNRGFSDEKLNYQDLYVVFSEEAILFSEGIPEFHESWRDIFQHDELLLDKLIVYFNSTDKKNAVSIRQFLKTKTPIAWRIEGLWIEGYGKLCFGAGKRLSNSQYPIFEDQSLDGIVPQKDDTEKFKKSRKTTLEQLVNRVSNRFLNSDIKSIDQNYLHALELVAKQKGAERANLFVTNPRELFLECAYEWKKNDLPLGVFPFKRIVLEGKEELVTLLQEQGFLLISNLYSWEYYNTPQWLDQKYRLLS